MRFLWWFNRRRLLVLWLGWWRDLLFVLFFSHLLKAVITRLWHLHGCWREQSSCSQTRLWADASLSKLLWWFLILSFIYSVCVIKIQLIYKTLAVTSRDAPSCPIQIFNPPSVSYIMSCYNPDIVYASHCKYSPWRNRVKYQKHLNFKKNGKLVQTG